MNDIVRINEAIDIESRVLFPVAISGDSRILIARYCGSEIASF